MAGKNKSKNSLTKPLFSPPDSDAVGKTESRQRKDRTAVEKKDRREELEVFLPGMKLAEGETLEVDLSAYVMLHELNAEWPCLSFDIVRDEGPEERTAFPMSGYLISGTQADNQSKNEIYLLRYTNLHKTRVKEEENDGDDDGSSESEDSGDEQEFDKKNPRHYCIAIPHDGGVNRIRSMRGFGGDQRAFAASWSDAGKVELWDLTNAYQELNAINLESPPSLVKRNNIKPVASIKRHSTEGFALAWSSIVSGRLLSGDCNGEIYFTELMNNAFNTDGGTPFKAHEGSVEDLQWSPSESTVFASSSVDGTVRVWDIRMPRNQAALVTQAHPCDANVISWNRLSNYLLASGADDGVFATWDLRSWSTDRSVQNIPLFANSWHKQAVTSIEWNPHDASILAVSGADDQITLWDLSIIDEAQDDIVNEVYDGNNIIPKQLLFIHQGQQEVKEIHWHSQLSGVLLSTALSGFNIFKTISV